METQNGKFVIVIIRSSVVIVDVDQRLPYEIYVAHCVQNHPGEHGVDTPLKPQAHKSSATQGHSHVRWSALFPFFNSRIWILDYASASAPDSFATLPAGRTAQ